MWFANCLLFRALPLVNLPCRCQHHHLGQNSRIRSVSLAIWFVGLRKHAPIVHRQFAVVSVLQHLRHYLRHYDAIVEPTIEEHLNVGLAGAQRSSLVGKTASGDLGTGLFFLDIARSYLRSSFPSALLLSAFNRRVFNPVCRLIGAGNLNCGTVTPFMGVARPMNAGADGIRALGKHYEPCVIWPAVTPGSKCSGVHVTRAMAQTSGELPELHAAFTLFFNDAPCNSCRCDCLCVEFNACT